MGQSPPSPVLSDRASPFNIVDRSTSHWSSFSFPNTGLPPDVILKKLSFKDRQISRGTIIVPYRLLCKQANESRNHTFFDCHFVKEKWIEVLSTSTLEDVIKNFGGLNKSDWIVLSFQVPNANPLTDNQNPSTADNTSQVLFYHHGQLVD
ncbi:hypothetical protein Peur_002126 [Populus x canadensis]